LNIDFLTLISVRGYWCKYRCLLSTLVLLSVLVNGTVFWVGTDRSGIIIARGLEITDGVYKSQENGYTKLYDMVCVCRKQWKLKRVISLTIKNHY